MQLAIKAVLIVLIGGWDFTGLAYSAESAIEIALPLKPISDIAGLPRVLIVGDSISIGYTLPTRSLLSGKANVHRVSGTWNERIPVSICWMIIMTL